MLLQVLPLKKKKSNQIVILFPDINAWALQEFVCHSSWAGGLCGLGNKCEILKALRSGNQDFISKLKEKIEFNNDQKMLLGRFLSY